MGARWQNRASNDRFFVPESHRDTMIATSVSHFVVTYGYVAVFLAVALESLGVPVPGETTLIAAAVYAGATHKLGEGPIVVIAAVGAIIGDNLGYVLGRTGGERLLLRVGRHIRIDESTLKMAQSIYSRHGGKIVFMGRFVSILRTYAAFLAGISKMAWARFLVYNTLSGVLWAVVFGVGAYEFGGQITRFGSIITIVFGVGALVVVVVGYVAARRYGAEIRTKVEMAALESR